MMQGDKLVASPSASTDIDFESSAAKAFQIVIASTDSHNHTVQRAFDICINSTFQLARRHLTFEIDLLKCGSSTAATSSAGSVKRKNNFHF